MNTIHYQIPSTYIISHRNIFEALVTFYLEVLEPSNHNGPFILLVRVQNINFQEKTLFEYECINIKDYFAFTQCFDNNQLWTINNIEPPYMTINITKQDLDSPFDLNKELPPIPQDQNNPFNLQQISGILLLFAFIYCNMDSVIDCSYNFSWLTLFKNTFMNAWYPSLFGKKFKDDDSFTCRQDRRVTDTHPLLKEYDTPYLDDPNYRGFIHHREFLGKPIKRVHFKDEVDVHLISPSPEIIELTHIDKPLPMIPNCNKDLPDPDYVRYS